MARAAAQRVRSNGLFSGARRLLTTSRFKVSATKQACKSKSVRLGTVRAKDSDDALRLVKDKLRAKGTLDAYGDFKITGRRVAVDRGEGGGADRGARPGAEKRERERQRREDERRRRGEERERERERKAMIRTRAKEKRDAERAEKKRRASLLAEQRFRKQEQKQREADERAFGWARAREPKPRRRPTLNISSLEEAREMFNPATRRNVAEGFFDGRGRFRPIRKSKDYNEFAAGDFNYRDRRLFPESMSLSQFVRSKGGIKPQRDGEDAGELRRLTRKESGTTGLVSLGSKLDAERMATAAREAGFRAPSNPNAFIEAVEADVRGYKKTWNDAKEWPDERDNPGIAARLAQMSAAYKQNKRGGRARKNPDGSAGEVHAKYENGHLLIDIRDKRRKRPGVEIWDIPCKAADAYRHLKAFADRNNYKIASYSGATTAELFNPKATGNASARKNPSAAFRRVGSEFLGRDIKPAERGYAPAGAPEHLTMLALKELVVDGELYEFNPERARVGIDGRGRLHLVNVRFGKPAELTNPKQIAVVGEIDSVVYGAHKPHIHGKFAFYRHKLGEDGGRKPSLTVDYWGLPRVRGGDYRIEPRGIVD